MDKIKETYRQWCESEYFDEATREELKALGGNEEEITDRFYQRLAFGTGGLRGVIGAGTNRMNIYTVRQATQGLANYINKMQGADRGVAVAYDSRQMSDVFAKEACLCLAANGIRTYIFESLRPTPELSFALRQLGCMAGIVITASHNPREYNGYKVYWEDGAQITPPHDKNIMEEVAKVTSWESIRTMEESDARVAGLYHVIGEEMDEKYRRELRKQSIHPKIIQDMAKDFTIVYTPLHGTGNVPVRKVLAELGFEKVYVQQEQKIADGRFPTVSYPNPEDPKAWERALALAKEKDADLVLATDPDADRLGVYCKDSKTGEYISFTGNMSGMLIAEYLLHEKKAMGTLPKRPVLVETIVTTDMAKAVAAAYGVELVEVLTGFKYIGEQIRLFEEDDREYVFGLEESYGCLAGTYARDKDAVVAVMLLCEVAAFYKKQGMTLWDAMVAMYERYGYYKEGLTSIEKKGISGKEEIAAIMDKLRSQIPEQLGDYQVLAYRDYQKGIRYDRIKQEESRVELPESNVLYYELSENAWVCVRPSGTEPKIKFYYGVKGSSLVDADAKLEELKDALLALANM